MSRKATERIRLYEAMWISTSAKLLFLFVAFFFLHLPYLSAQHIPIGGWNSHFNYLSAHQLAQTGNRIFCASYNGLFSVNLSGTEQRVYGKQDGLTETGVSSLAFDQETNMLLIAYRSGNIDLLFLDENSELERVESWPAFQSASDLPDKKNISKILFHNEKAYLATNFGVVILDISNREVLENYRYIGINGAEAPIKDIAFTTDSIYVLTSQGLQASSADPSINRQYFANWKMVTSPAPVTAITSQNNVIYGGLSGKGIYQLLSGNWKLVLTSASTNYSFSGTDQGISVTLDDRHLFLPKTGENSIVQSPSISAPKKSVTTTQGTVWIADSKNGLLSNTDGAVKMYNPVQQDTTINPRTDSSIVDLAGLHWTRLPSYLAGGILVRNNVTNKERNLNTSVGNGALPSSAINSIVLDQDGYIWFASDRGVGYLFPDEVLNGTSVNAILPIYGQRKLFANEKCTAMAVESGNRKWIGTRNGLYIFSSDGTELLSHFTAANSPLPSDVINSLKFESETGLLFVDTPNGMVSYRTNSVAPSENLSDITIFPNPVRPGYSGQVGIKGLTDQSTVKITQLSGRLVYETRSEGGLASWNLNDYTGKRAKGGIYMIVVTSQNGDQKIAGKLAIID